MPIYQFVKSLTPQQQRDVRDLYRSAGWWFAADENRPHLLSRIIAGSHCFCIALEGEAVIGIGRAISDGVSDAYLQDITVRADFRRQGIGLKLTKFIVDSLKDNGIHWIGLIATPDSHEIYKALGFKDLSEDKAMRLNLHDAPGESAC